MRYLLVVIIIVSTIAILILPQNSQKSNLSATLKLYHLTKELPELYPYPVPVENFKTPPPISAKSAVVIDAKTGVVLYERDPDIRHLPASTAKLMTALVSLERCSPDKVISIGSVNSEGTQMGLSTGDLVTVRNLLYGLLVASGNDAAYALAYGCYNSYEQFISSMNQKANELGMANTRFENPAGFDSPSQYTTARDLVKLAKVAVANPLIAQIVATKSIVLTDETGNKAYYLENINELLGEVEGLEGIKTGQTEGSLQILVSKTTRDSNTIIVAILGSSDRFDESKKIIEWAFANHRWLAP